MKFLEQMGWVLGEELELWIWELVERYGLPERCPCGIELTPARVKVTSHRGRFWCKCTACERMFRITH